MANTHAHHHLPNALLLFYFIAVKYDPGKELKEQLEKKQRKLKEIEETKEKAGKTEEASNPGFVEKLITQIIRNVQVGSTHVYACVLS